VDLGPEGGDEGGRVVATGTPEEIAAVSGSYTGLYLKEVLAKGTGYRPFALSPEQIGGTSKSPSEVFPKKSRKVARINSKGSNSKKMNKGKQEAN